MRSRLPSLPSLLLLLLLFAPTLARADEEESKDAGLKIGGWAETLVQKFDRTRQDGRRSGLTPRADFLRAALEFERRFDERLAATVELEIEHAGIVEDEVGIEVDTTTGRGNADLGGELRLEEAYVDWTCSEALAFRAGLVLVPVGLVNLHHEPGDYLGALRHDVERRVIPSTWSALGAGVMGRREGGLAWQAFLLEGLDASRFESNVAIREGRRKGSNAPATHAALAARLDWDRSPLGLGGALYSGDSWQGVQPAAGTMHARVTLAEAHAALEWRGLRARGLYAMGTLSDHEALSRELGVFGTDRALGRRFFGGYAEAGYDVLPVAYPGTKRSLVAFARYEESDTQDGVGSAGTEDPANHWTTLTVGLVCRPHEDLVLKADRQQRHNESRTATGQWNLGLGFEF